MNLPKSHAFRLRKLITAYACILFVIQFLPVRLFAQDEKTATIKLSFEQNDSTRLCKATVTSDNKPVSEIEIHFYVKRMYSLLPIGKAIETDTNGEAIAYFPLDLPGDKNGDLIAIAKIEDDETFGNVETSSNVKWGIIHSLKHDDWNDRSLSASRDKAPMILIIVSNLIIAGIWATIIYIIYQVLRIKRASQMLKSKDK